MENQLFENLYKEGLISDVSFERITQRRSNLLYSVYWEVKTLLYLGILLLTTGLGLLVYKNINSISHVVILTFLILLSGGCFIYCFKYKRPFSLFKVQSPKVFLDYVLLLAVLSMLIFIGYIQYQYQAFGIHYGMATFIPTLILFYLAYSFDHEGILNMAIINLGLWLGVSVTPKSLLAHHTFNSETIILTYLGFGFILLLTAWLINRYTIKPHFRFSYHHYGVHIAFIALLAGYFYNYDSIYVIFWILGLLMLAAFIINDAYLNKSFYFLMISISYTYVAVSSLLCRAILAIGDTGSIELLFMYFILSAIGLIALFIRLNAKLKAA